VGEDGEDPAVVVAAFGEVELEENVVYVGLHGAFADDKPLRDTGVGEALRHELQYPPFTLGQPVQGTPRCGGHEPGDDLRVECRAAVGDPLGRVEEVAHLEHPVLQEVAEAGPADQVDGMGGLDVLGQEQHPDTGATGLELARGPSSLVGVRRGHADVEDHQVRSLPVGHVDDGAGVTQRCHHVVPAVGEQPGEPLPEQNLVLDDHDTHGSSAVIRVPRPRTLSM
jgi:hypothetical protein